MEKDIFRILLVADTHIGLDFPLHPRIQRRRRGEDFLSNFRLALQPALRGEVDAVVHGGDLFDREHVPDALVQMAMEPLLQAAEKDLPILLVPGNHERGKIPLHLWRSHPNLKIFDQPDTFLVQKHGLRIAFSGFPYARKVRTQFKTLVDATGYRQESADLRLLCIHHAVEGAQVGPADFTFRYAADVVRGQDIPANFDEVLSGHIHRCQVLQQDLTGRSLPAPVIYPGSVERTAFAEQAEQKAYITLDLKANNAAMSRITHIRVHPLPARPMVSLDLKPDDMSTTHLRGWLQENIRALDPNTVVLIRLQGEINAQAWEVLNASSLRTLAPETMNISLSTPRLRDTPPPNQPSRGKTPDAGQSDDMRLY